MKGWFLLLATSSLVVHSYDNETFDSGTETDIEIPLSNKKDGGQGRVRSRRDNSVYMSEISVYMSRLITLSEKLSNGEIISGEDLKEAPIHPNSNIDDATRKDLKFSFGGVQSVSVDDVFATAPPTEYTGDEDDRLKEGLAMMFEMLKGGLNDVPFVSSTMSAVAPIVDKFLRKDKNDVKIIQKGFREINNVLNQHVGRVELAIELVFVKEVEQSAGVLIQYLEDVINEKEGGNDTIGPFLDMCKEINPYKSILSLNTQIEKALRMQLGVDVYHSKKNLIAMKHKLYGILHELTFVSLFEHQLNRDLTDKDRENNLEKLTNKMDKIKNNTNSLLMELLDTKYWSHMPTFVETVMKGYEHSDMSAKADQLAAHLFDIHTNDRFCLMVYSGEHDWEDCRAHTENRNYYFNEEYLVTIVRSESAHTADMAAFREKVAAMKASIGNRCLFDPEGDRYLHGQAQNYNLTTVFSDLTFPGRKNRELKFVVKCDARMFYMFEATCQTCATGLPLGYAPQCANPFYFLTSIPL